MNEIVRLPMMKLLLHEDNKVDSVIVLSWLAYCFMLKAELSDFALSSPSSYSVSVLVSASNALPSVYNEFSEGILFFLLKNGHLFQVLSVFECPVCLEYMLPPYLQCQAGHLVCGNCRPKLQCCPTCRGPTPSVRNLGLEKIANTVRFPCKFASSGCPHVFYHFDKVEHEEICECRPYSCPCPGAACKWQGALNDVMDHLKKVHKSITTLQGEDIVFLATDINLPGAVDWVMMQSCFGYNFMLVLGKF
ncbi:unnamed protein product, partial [Strongylus vulgaris]